MVYCRTDCMLVSNEISSNQSRPKDILMLPKSTANPRKLTEEYIMTSTGLESRIVSPLGKTCDSGGAGVF